MFQKNWKWLTQDSKKINENMKYILPLQNDL